MEDNKKNIENIDKLDKFICTVIKPLYFLGLIISVSLMLIVVNNYSKYFNVLWIVSFIIFEVVMNIVYIISKKIKEKTNRLRVYKVNILKKILFILVSLIIAMLNAIILAGISVNIMLN